MKTNRLLPLMCVAHPKMLALGRGGFVSVLPSRGGRAAVAPSSFAQVGPAAAWPAFGLPAVLTASGSTSAASPWLGPQQGLAGTIIPGYVPRNVAGWTVHVGPATNDAETASIAHALHVLEHQLAGVRRQLPQAALRQLVRVPIWLNGAQEIPESIAYHRSPDWLRQNGQDPRKARCIEIGNAARFVEYSQVQPSIVLHELAHAYQDQILDEAAHAAIERAYRDAVASGAYDKVLDYRGHIRRAYALTDPWEYFAETSEAFFGRNDFAPFDRRELEQHDPAMAELLRNLWGAR